MPYNAAIYGCHGSDATEHWIACTHWATMHVYNIVPHIDRDVHALVGVVGTINTCKTKITITIGKQNNWKRVIVR